MVTLTEIGLRGSPPIELVGPIADEAEDTGLIPVLSRPSVVGSRAKEENFISPPKVFPVPARRARQVFPTTWSSFIGTSGALRQKWLCPKELIPWTGGFDQKSRWRLAWEYGHIRTRPGVVFRAEVCWGQWLSRLRPYKIT
ncbi:unnamed protein product [Blepharisma stoltei]|uniref:Uncharacterized protein n=1 Tax=Blepharisma stoltei TaxID=1481888 RepID=A0AAU9KCE0_9CILI|nr:unnamed protein product [Blepharisma stoltei]